MDGVAKEYISDEDVESLDGQAVMLAEDLDLYLLLDDEWDEVVVPVDDVCCGLMKDPNNDVTEMGLSATFSSL